MKAGEIRAALKPHLDIAQHKNDMGGVAHLVVHFAIAIASLSAAALHIHDWPWYITLGLAVIAGHSGLVCSFAGHEIAHGVGKMPRWVRRSLELIGWTFTIFATATSQRRAHNVAHHRHTNTPHDPDRRLTLAECEKIGPITRVMEWLVPNRRHPTLTMIWGFSFMIYSYHTSLLVHTQLQTGELYDLKMEPRERRRFLAEVMLNIGILAGIWALSGFSLYMLFLIWVTYFTATTIAGWYITTNHLLTGFEESGNHPLSTTVSLELPRWIDWLHLNFSHHTEHHLYPAYSYHALPKIKAALQREFAAEYKSLTWFEAIALLRQSHVAMLDHQTYVSLDGEESLGVFYPTTEPSSAPRQPQPETRPGASTLPLGASIEPVGS